MTENGRIFFNGKHVLRTRMVYYYIILSSEAKMDNKIDRRPVVAIRSRRFIRFLCCRHRTRHMCMHAMNSEKLNKNSGRPENDGPPLRPQKAKTYILMYREKNVFAFASTGCRPMK